MKLPTTEKTPAFTLLLFLILAFAAIPSAFAQSPETGGGVDTCKNSPENPTAILALAGSAGGVLMAVRSRLRRK